MSKLTKTVSPVKIRKNKKKKKNNNNINAGDDL